MIEPQQQVDAFSMMLMEQRNSALNEAAYWKSQVAKLQAQVAELEARLPKPKAKKEEAK